MVITRARPRLVLQLSAHEVQSKSIESMKTKEPAYVIHVLTGIRQCKLGVAHI